MKYDAAQEHGAPKTLSSLFDVELGRRSAASFGIAANIANLPSSAEDGSITLNPLHFFTGLMPDCVSSNSDQVLVSLARRGPRETRDGKDFNLSQAVIDRSKASTTAFAILAAISVCHFLNDTMQTLLPALYPLFRSGLGLLNFVQLGVLTLAFQVTGSLLQPFVGRFTDRRPQPYSLPVGMTFTMAGILVLADARPSYPLSSSVRRCWASAMLSSIRNRRASPGLPRRCSRARPVCLPGRRQRGSLARPAVTSSFFRAARAALLVRLGGPPRQRHPEWPRPVVKSAGQARPRRREHRPPFDAAEVAGPARARRLVALIFSKFFYLASITNYYIFYLMQHFHLPTRTARGSVRLPRRGGGRYDHRRPRRGPVRPQDGDLGVDPRRPAVHARAALRRSDRGFILTVVHRDHPRVAFSAIWSTPRN